MGLLHLESNPFEDDEEDNYEPYEVRPDVASFVVDHKERLDYLLGGLVVQTVSLDDVLVVLHIKRGFFKTS
jgi:hypothetical protein